MHAVDSLLLRAFVSAACVRMRRCWTQRDCASKRRLPAQAKKKKKKKKKKAHEDTYKLHPSLAISTGGL